MSSQGVALKMTVLYIDTSVWDANDHNYLLHDTDFAQHVI